MRKCIPILIILFSLNNALAQEIEHPIDIRYKGKEIGFRKYLAHNLKYPVNSVMENSLGYSISSISITPKGKIHEIAILNSLDKFMDKEVVRLLRNTRGDWIKADDEVDTITFYVQIVFFLSMVDSTPKIDSPVSGEYNFIKPVVVTVYGFNNGKLESNENWASKCTQFMKDEEYMQALDCINELIRRNPFNEDFYRIRIHISKKLDKQNIIMQDIEKLNNFIPGVTLNGLLLD